ncbi:efflux RND transporter periplasmic adaptor subunit [Halomonas sp. V046]|uniref:efflux RND transporter periplasmic adaptor subunit n=1 Tax=Halomonas sp. V046 TaxID=3459611 RepID=UPI004043E977
MSLPRRGTAVGTVVLTWGLLVTGIACADIAVPAGVPEVAGHRSTGAGEESARGVLRAEHEAILASTLSARVVEMPFQEGDAFTADQSLVSFDCSRLNAEWRAARAQASAQARDAQVQRELLQMGATGRADLDIAVLKVSELRARAAAIHSEIDGCEVKAPFAGRVVEPMVRANETPAANEPLIHVVSDGALELDMVVPSCWLAWLRPGVPFTFDVDETGDELKASVARISASVDPVSQTVKVISRIAEVPERVLPGMSGTATWHRLAATNSCAVGQPS